MNSNINTSNATSGAILSDFKRQTLENAINYYEKVKQSNSQTDILENWLNCSSTIIWATTTMEGFLSNLISEKHGHQNYASLIQNHNFGFNNKIKFLKDEFSIDIKNNNEWANIQQTVWNRNDIIHFNMATTNLMTSDNAKNSMQACQDLIKLLKVGFTIPCLNPFYENFLVKTL